MIAVTQSKKLFIRAAFKKQPKEDLYSKAFISSTVFRDRFRKEFMMSSSAESDTPTSESQTETAARRKKKRAKLKSNSERKEEAHP